MILTIRTTIGRENVVIGEIEERAKTSPAKLKAVMHPEKLKGYVMVEGEEEDVKTIISGLRHVNGMISNPVNLEDLKKFISEKGEDVEVHKGDVVEITGGPFKRERGKVVRVDAMKQEVTVELLEAAIPIPVTISLDSIRVLEKTKDTIQESLSNTQTGATNA